MKTDDLRHILRPLVEAGQGVAITREVAVLTAEVAQAGYAREGRLARVNAALDALPVAGATEAEAVARREAVALLRRIVLEIEEIGGWSEPVIRAVERGSKRLHARYDDQYVDVNVTMDGGWLFIEWSGVGDRFRAGQHWQQVSGWHEQPDADGLTGLLRWLGERMR